MKTKITHHLPQRHFEKWEKTRLYVVVTNKQTGTVEPLPLFKSFVEACKVLKISYTNYRRYQFPFSRECNQFIMKFDKLPQDEWVAEEVPKKK